jgi:hypothetical protein
MELKLLNLFKSKIVDKIKQFDNKIFHGVQKGIWNFKGIVK